MFWGQCRIADNLIATNMNCQVVESNVDQSICLTDCRSGIYYYFVILF